MKNVRIVATLHYTEGLNLTCTNVDGDPRSKRQGHATSREKAVAFLIEAGYPKEAETLRVTPTPKKDPIDIVFILPESELLMDKLGLQ